MRFFITLLFLSFFLINCDNSTRPHSSGTLDLTDTNSENSSAIIGNWEPGEYREITSDSNGNIIVDTTYSSYYDMFSEFNMEIEAILQVVSANIISHMLIDGEYTIDQMGYSLSGDNLTLSDMEADYYDLLFYKATIEDGKLLLHSKYKLTDASDISDLGYTYAESYMYYDKYTGEIPPSDWPALTEAPVEDNYEIDNTYSTANTINTDGQNQAHSIHVYDDVDWLKFNAESGKTYTIRSSGSIDVYAYLYDTNGISELKYDDDIDIESDTNFEIIWDCLAAGTYYIKIESYEIGDYGVSVNEGRRVVSTINKSGNIKKIKKPKFVLPGIILK